MDGKNRRGLIRDLHHLPLLFKVVDVFLIYTSLYLLSLMFSQVEWIPNYNLLAATAMLIFIFAAESAKLYQSWRGVDFTSLIKRVLVVWFMTALSLMMLGYFTKVTSEFSRLLVTQTEYS